jgi:hypothetical protein
MMSRNNKSINNYVVPVLIVLLLSSVCFGQERDERRLLVEQELQLREKVELLKQEQDYLLFQKALAAADSKYLILDVRNGKGMLKYRNRILRSFKFPDVDRSLPGAAASGAITLTGKIDGPTRKRQLIFDNSRLILEAKHTALRASKGKPAVRIPLVTKDLGALFFVLERGSMAFIIR